MVVEEEDKPKPEGEQLSAREKELAKLIEKLREEGAPRAAELRQRELEEEKKRKGKSDEDLLAEIVAIAEKISQLVREKNDWEAVEDEFVNRLEDFNHLQVKFAKRPKKAGDYSKWAEMLEAKSLVSLAVEDWNIEEFRRKLHETVKKLNNIELLEEGAKEKGLPRGEYLQLQTIASLKEMFFQNYEFSIFSRKRSIEGSIATNRFQAAATDTMLEVRKNLEKIAETQAHGNNLFWLF